MTIYVSYNAHPHKGDPDLEAALQNDLGVPAHALRYRPLAIPLADLAHVAQHPENFIEDGDDDGYENALQFADSYRAGHDVPPITVSKAPWLQGRWQIADGWHRIAGAHAAQVPSISALEAFVPNRVDSGTYCSVCDHAASPKPCLGCPNAHACQYGANCRWPR